MKKVLLSSVAALAVFAAAAPAFAADTTPEERAEAYAQIFGNQPGATPAATPAAGTSEASNSFTRTNKEDRAKDPAFVGKQDITSQDHYTGEN